MSDEGSADDGTTGRKRKRKRKKRPKYDSNYRIEIIGPRCTAVMTCMDEASRTFDLNDDAVAFVSDPNGNSDAEILAAAKSCPVDAIFLYDKTTGEKVWPPREKRFVDGEDQAS